MNEENAPSQINKKHTPCKGCGFGVYDGKTQTGCELSMLDKLKEQDEDVEILDAYDNDLEFFIVNNKYCHVKRGQDWIEQVPEEKRLEQIEKELKYIDYQVIIIADDDEANTQKTLDSVTEQTVAPGHITILRKVNSMVRPSNFNKMLVKAGRPWRVQNAVNPGLPVASIIDLVLDVRRHKFCCVIDANTTLNNKKQLEDIQYAILNEGLVFALLEAEGVQIFSGVVHKVLQGSFEKPFTEKIKKEWPEQIINLQKI